MISPKKDGTQEYYNENQRDFYCYPDDYTKTKDGKPKRGKNCTLYLDTFYDDRYLIAEIRSLIWAATGYDISRPGVNRLIAIAISTGMLSYLRDELRDPNSSIWNYIASMNDHGTVLAKADSVLDHAFLQSNTGKYFTDKQVCSWITEKRETKDNDLIGYSVPSRCYTGNENKVLKDLYPKEDTVPGDNKSLYANNTYFQR